MDNQPFSNMTTGELNSKLKNLDHSSSMKLFLMYCTNDRAVNMK